MRRLLVLLPALVLAFALAGSAMADDGEDAATKTWQVTVTNLTPAGSQPLSPPLLVVHSRAAEVRGVGEIANHGVAAIAEDANNSVLEAVLPHVDGVKSVATGAGGPIPSGESRTYVVEASGRFSRLTLLTMSVNTNDAFTGLDALRLWARRSAGDGWRTTRAASATTSSRRTPARAAGIRSSAIRKER